MGRVIAKKRIKPDRSAAGSDSIIRELTDKAPAAIFIFQGSKNCVVNPAAATLTGYSREELLSMNFWDIVHPGYKEMIKQRGIARQRGVKVPPRYELKIMRKDGTERWLDYSGAPIRYRGKSAVIGTAIDITKRKLAEEQLHRQFQNLQLLHDTHLALTSNLDLISRLNVLLENIDRFLPCPIVGVVRVLSARTGNPEVTALKNMTEEEWSDLVPDGSHGLSRDVLANRNRVIAENALQDPRTKNPDLFRRKGLVSYLGLPLIVADQVLGDIAIFTTQRYEFSHEELEFLETLASQASIAIHNAQSFAQTKRRAEELAALNAIASATSQSLDIDTILQNAAQSVVELFHFDGARIYLFDEVADQVRLQVTYKTDPEPWTQVGTIERGKGIIGKVGETGEPAIFEDIQTDPRYEQLTQTGAAKWNQARFVGVIPICTKLKSWGAIACMAKESRRLSIETLDLLISIANQIGIAIENTSLYRSTIKKNNEIAALLGVASIAAHFLDLNVLLRQSMRKILDIFGFTAASVYLIDNDKKELRLELHEGFNEVPPATSYRLGEGLISIAAETGTPLVFEDIQTDPKYQQLAQTKQLLQAGFHGLFFIPIGVRGETLGVMTVVGKQPRPFPPSDLALINAIAYHLGIAIGSASLVSQLQQKTVELEKANSAKNEFLSIISHELRTPINVISGYTALIRLGAFGNLTPDSEAVVAKVEEQTETLLSLVESILVTTELVMGETELSVSDINLVGLLHALRTLYPSPGNRDLKIIWDIPSDLPAINTDGKKLSQILKGLIDNAIKFTEEGSVTIAARHDIGAQRIRLEVCDTGIGISEIDLAGIFDMFRQVDSSTSRSHEGMGLGLFVVKKLADLLGGDVSVESAPGRGSKFTVVVPTKL